MTLHIGISAEPRAAVAKELAILLADEYVLMTKTRHAHWSVVGPDFMEKHAFFDDQYAQLADFVDQVAERIRSLGHFPPATLSKFLELTQLTELDFEKNNSEGFIRELLHDHESIISFLRSHIVPFADTHQDMGTSDFITGLMEEHEKMAWFLRAHLGE